MTRHDSPQVDQYPSPVAGIRLATACAAIRQNKRADVTLIELAEGASCAAVFTQNRFCAAPVILARAHLAQGAPRYLLINSGNANAGMGDIGLADAEACCQALAAKAGVEAAAVLPFSTGVIGERLAVAKIEAVMETLVASLAADHWAAAAQAIMTTDTVEKVASTRVESGGKTLTVTGIAKGSGMIHPNMATMLAYIATDAGVDKPLLQRCLQEAVADSFNCITVDGDTSTNDACVLMASGQGDWLVSDADTDAYAALRAAVGAVCESLAQAIVADGEGATRLVHVVVEGGASTQECRKVADAVALSPLVKTALFAQDPNWGRVLAAVGRAGIDDLDVKGVTIHFDDVLVAERGGRAASYSEADGRRVLAQREYRLRIGLGRGGARIRLSTCDFSYDYVRINAEYRS